MGLEMPVPETRLNTQMAIKLPKHMGGESFVDADVEDLTADDKLVLLILGYSKRTTSTRLHKLSLLVNAIVEGKRPSTHGAYYYGGFSDEVDSAMIQLEEDGLIKRTGEKQLSLTEYGEKVKDTLSKSSDDQTAEVRDTVRFVADSLKAVPDQDLVDLTYILFPELTTRSVIKSKVDERIRSRKLRGVNVYQFRRDELTRLLREYIEQHTK